VTLAWQSSVLSAATATAAARANALVALCTTEIPTARCLGALEYRGIAVNVSLARAQIALLHRCMQHLYDTLLPYTAGDAAQGTGGSDVASSFDIASHSAVSSLLFSHLGLPSDGSRSAGRRNARKLTIVDASGETAGQLGNTHSIGGNHGSGGTGLVPSMVRVAGAKAAKHSTRASVLQELVRFHPAPLLIAAHRSADKVADRIKQLAGAAAESGSGIARVFALFNQTDTETGRVSITEPPLQQTPKQSTATFPFPAALTDPGNCCADAVEFRALLRDAGAILGGSDKRGAVVVESHESQPEPTAALQCPVVWPALREFSIVPRRVISAPPGRFLLEADWAQVELRVCANLAQSDTLATAFSTADATPDGDVFRELAATHFRLNVDEVTPHQRNSLKTCVYALLYGAGPGFIASKLECPMTVASELIDNFYDSHPAVLEFTRKVHAATAANGTAYTLRGRPRRLAHAIEHASNPEVLAKAQRQAFSHTVQGTAADLLKEAMLRLERLLPSVCATAAAVLTVHDSIIVETPAGHALQVAKCLAHCMTWAEPGWTVPIKAKVAVGVSWGELKPFAAEELS
jgi:DNA polymerase I-like protein with 3'-5' exonuclease and polymerase domains